ncbi:Chorein_N domain-containing protein [Cephalotus follicularis]|uniref:Chorein_N domain-containing protein n=1 Tax=Cephalotus follicularis TaxID=3775 RepID=A0A1Q3AZ89_CEPFO|nr:Chorein_N domain-containing protein [Cephalotus follicularis]
MESIVALALEYTLKYWLKSFSRDQFKLQGRTVQLSNLDINGDALHASMGLPPALNVTTAKVGKLEIMLPYITYVQTEPIVVQIDRLDLVLEENQDVDVSESSSSIQSSTTPTKGNGYGFADKIADGMSLEIRTVNLLLETRGARCQGGATWASPLAAITIRGLFLYTTNENWQVVNLKEARDFSTNKKFIYVFKKLVWESLSIDLLPHPDMFTDANIADSQEGANQRDDDGAKRVFFGGERFIEGVSGEAHITVQRTELNSPLGLEVQLHITEAVCPALSEPGLRAFLRFLTGLYVCLNRGDVDSKTQQRSTEAAGRSLVSIVVDHIFLCIKDAEFQLELLMQSLFFSRASVADGENENNLTRVMVGGLFLRDTFSRLPCTLAQPSMQAVAGDLMHIPDFGKNLCPPIYPLGNQQWHSSERVPLICLHSLQVKPSPPPPAFASQSVIHCQPLMIHLQEESCLRICSFLADGIVVNPGVVLPDYSVNSLIFSLKELDLSVPLDKSDNPVSSGNPAPQNSFAGARLHIENLFFSESPSLKLRLLNLEKDPACFILWADQPIDASQKKWTIRASQLCLSLETSMGSTIHRSSLDRNLGLWRCVDLKDACIEVAMATTDGNPLTDVPPPGGIVRVGVACQQYLSNTSVEQLFFVLDLYAYFGVVSEKIARIRKNSRPRRSQQELLRGSLKEKVPCDTAVSLAVKDLQLRFLEFSSKCIQEMPLVQFIGDDLFIKVSHRTLGGAIAVSSALRWGSVQIDCMDSEGNIFYENGKSLTSVDSYSPVTANEYPQLRPVFWVHNKRTHTPLLDISVVHVIPLDERDSECHSLSVSACVSGVRLGGGMNYAESLLHQFGIFGPDGGPGKGLSKGLDNLSAGPLSKLFRSSPLSVDDQEEDRRLVHGKDGGFLYLEKPDDVDITIEFKDWLFALEGAQEMAEWLQNHDVDREERCWHTTFQSLQVKAKSSPKHSLTGDTKLLKKQRYPVELVAVGVAGLQILKPRAQRGILDPVLPANGSKETMESSGGINVDVCMVISEDDIENEPANWMVENVKFSVKQPIEAVVTKDELQHLAYLCKSEIDSMGRIAAGILRLLKLEQSVGQGTLDQLSNLGSEGIDQIFSPEKVGRGASSIVVSPLSNLVKESPCSTLELTVASLEEAVIESRVQCAALTELGSSKSSIQCLATIEQLRKKLESMQDLLTQLRTQI